MSALFWPVFLPFSPPEVNGFASRVQRGGWGGSGNAGDKGVGDTGALGSGSASKRCIVSLLHSFLILRSACVANPQKLRPSLLLRSPVLGRSSSAPRPLGNSFSLRVRCFLFSYFSAPPSTTRERFSRFVCEKVALSRSQGTRNPRDRVNLARTNRIALCLQRRTTNRPLEAFREPSVVSIFANFSSKFVFLFSGERAYSIGRAF